MTSSAGSPTGEKKTMGKATLVMGKGSKRKGEEEDREKKNVGPNNSGSAMTSLPPPPDVDETGNEEDARRGLFEGMTSTEFFCLDDEEDVETVGEEEEESSEKAVDPEDDLQSSSSADASVRRRRRKKKRDYDEASTKSALDSNIQEAQCIIKDMRGILFQLVTTLEDIEVSALRPDSPHSCRTSSKTCPAARACTECRRERRNGEGRTHAGSRREASSRPTA